MSGGSTPFDGLDPMASGGAGPASRPPVRVVPNALVLHRSGQPDAWMVLREDRVYSLGRQPNMDVVFTDALVSRQHAVLRFQATGWVYQDLGSANGSLLHRAAGTGAPAPVNSAVVPLNVGDALALGGPRAWMELVRKSPAELWHHQVRARPVTTAARDFESHLELAARTLLPVFLLGKGGTGKAHHAHLVHLLSGVEGPFVHLDCSQLPEDPVGVRHELVGQDPERPGRCVVAGGGTLFLQNVDRLGPAAQAVLVDALGGRAGAASAGPRVRLVGGSRVPLSAGALRDDLTQLLLEGHVLRLPSLAERARDIPVLVRQLLLELRDETGVEAQFSDAAMEAAATNPWPGEVRELRATVRAVVLSAFVADPAAPVVVSEAQLQERRDQMTLAFGLPSTLKGVLVMAAPGTQDGRPVHPRTLTAQDIHAALEANGGNKSAAAKQLGVARNTLVAKMRTFGLQDR